VARAETFFASTGGGSLSLRAAAGGRRRRRLISLTPLIDVVFILLVFFMLASSFLQWRSIDLYTAGSGKPIAAIPAVTIAVFPDRIAIGGEAILLEELAARVQSIKAAEPDTGFQVGTSADVTLQRTVDVLDRLAAAGAANVLLVRRSEE
jgi:biopolymer transport protein ExbD